MKQPIAHIFFDLDRTLWDFDTNSREAIRDLFGHFRVQERTGAHADEFHRVYAGINEHYWERYRKGQVTQAQLRSGRFEDALLHFGLHDPDMAHAMGEAYVEISPRKTALVDGTLELLGHLRGRYGLHIITNGFEEVQHIKLTSTGIRGYFGEVVTSERAGVKKPDVGIFRFAEQLTGAHPERCVMIGDHLEADVQGAHRAGWQTIHFNPDGAQDHPHHQVTSLRQLMEVL